MHDIFHWRQRWQLAGTSFFGPTLERTEGSSTVVTADFYERLIVQASGISSAVYIGWEFQLFTGG